MYASIKQVTKRCVVVFATIAGIAFFEGRSESILTVANRRQSQTLPGNAYIVFLVVRTSLKSGRASLFGDPKSFVIDNSAKTVVHFQRNHKLRNS